LRVFCQHQIVLLVSRSKCQGENDQETKLYGVRHKNNLEEQAVIYKKIESASYKQIYDHYKPDQKLLEAGHNYKWTLGENCTEDIPQNEYLLKGFDKKKIRDSTFTELFEIFFSSELKKV